MEMKLHELGDITKIFAFYTPLEVTFKDPENFLKIKETLTRIGVASQTSNTLWQSCHILHKRRRYFIVHFKELFMLDGKESNLLEGDVLRRDTIARLLEEWNLLKIIGGVSHTRALLTTSVKIIPFHEKSQWELEPKYRVGKRRA